MEKTAVMRLRALLPLMLLVQAIMDPVTDMDQEMAMAVIMAAAMMNAPADPSGLGLLALLSF